MRILQMKLSSMLTKSSRKIFLVSFAFGDEDTQQHRYDEEALA
jgi:hypothetical protein